MTGKGNDAVSHQIAADAGASGTASSAARALLALMVALPGVVAEVSSRTDGF